MSNTPPDTSEGTVKAKRPLESDTPGDKDPPPQAPSSFLGIPPVNMNVDMDIRKWNWPGYLTFGRGTSKRPAIEDNKKPPTPTINKPESGDARNTVVEVDTQALEDAISDNTSITSSSMPNDGPVVHGETDGISEPKGDSAANESNEAEAPPINFKQLQPSVDADPGSLKPSTPPLEAESPSQTPSPHISSTIVYLSDPENPLLTLRQKVYYILVSFKYTCYIITATQSMIACPYDACPGRSR